MCGISGMITAQPDSLLAMKAGLGLMSHRGPDGAGLWYSPGGSAVIGHRRLAIIDLSEAAAQPMTDATGNYVKVVQRVPVKIVLDDPADQMVRQLAPGMSVIPEVDVSARPGERK